MSGINSVPQCPIMWEQASTVIVPQINAEGLHVWPFDKSFPLDVRYLSLDFPCRMRMNRHSFFELAFVHGGRAELQVQDRVFEVRPGDLMVIGGSLYHRMTSISEDPLDIQVVFFEPEVIQGQGENGEGDQYLAPFIIQNSDFPHVVPADCDVPGEISSLVSRLHATLPATFDRSRLTARTYLRMILLLLVNHYAEFCDTQESFARRQRDLGRLNPVFQWVEDSCFRPLRVHEAAQLCGMSDSHFMNFFKAVTGQPFLKYVNHFKIAKAQLMLSSTDESIACIAQELGFCDQSHFGVCFRETVGVTPRAYRYNHPAPQNAGNAK